MRCGHVVWPCGVVMSCSLWISGYVLIWGGCWCWCHARACGSWPYPHLAFFCLRDIEQGEEITWKYNQTVRGARCMLGGWKGLTATEGAQRKGHGRLSFHAAPIPGHGAAFTYSPCSSTAKLFVPLCFVLSCTFLSCPVAAEAHVMLCDP